MNILQTRSGFEDNGPGSQSLTIATELRKRGHNVEFAASQCVMIDQIIQAGFVFNKCDGMSRDKRNIFNFIKSIFFIRNLIKEKSIDVIHAHNATSAIAAFCAKLMLKKKVRVFHSVRGIELRPNYKWRNWIYKVYPIHMFAVCQFTKNELIKLGANKKNITVTYNGVNLTKFDIKKANKDKIRKEFGIPKKDIIIGHVGAMSTNTKGQHVLIQAFSMLCKEYTNIRLVFVGDGESLASFKSLAKQLEIQDRIIFTGRRFDIPDMQSAFDIFCLTSIWGEMFPNAILEAMSMGNPWIGSDISGLSELTAQNKAGIVIPPGDVKSIYYEIKILIDNESLRLDRGKMAYNEVINKFTIDKVVDRIEKAYKKYF